MCCPSTQPLPEGIEVRIGHRGGRARREHANTRDLRQRLRRGSTWHHEHAEGEEEANGPPPLAGLCTMAPGRYVRPVGLPDTGTHDSFLAVQHTPSSDAAFSLFSSPVLRRQPNAGRQARREAGAERTLDAVACTPLLCVPRVPTSTAPSP